MADWDAIIIGGGPAGLTAGLYLCRSNWRTLLIEKGSVGGQIMNVEYIENYPGHSEGILGSELAMEMKNQARKYGLTIQRNEVAAIQGSPKAKYVTCNDGSTLSTSALVIASGSVPRKLGVPGEDRLQGKGVFTCALCDGSQYADRTVAVCGGGDAAVAESLYIAKIASKVIVLYRGQQLGATAVLRDRLQENANVEVRCGAKVEAITGGDRVEAIEYTDSNTGEKCKLMVNGVLVHVGTEPNTGFLQETLPLDDQGHVIVNSSMETGVAGIFAAGDVRSGSPRQVSTAVGDGATAAIAAQRFLRNLAV